MSCVSCNRGFDVRRTRVAGSCGCEVCCFCMTQHRFWSCPRCKRAKSFAHHLPPAEVPHQTRSAPQQNSTFRRNNVAVISSTELTNLRVQLKTAQEQLSIVRERAAASTKNAEDLKQKLAALELKHVCSLCKALTCERQLRICQTCTPLAEDVDVVVKEEREVEPEFVLEKQPAVQGPLKDKKVKFGTMEEMKDVLVCATCCIDGVHAGHQTVSYLSHLFRRVPKVFDIEDTKYIIPSPDGFDMFYKVAHSNIMKTDLEAVRKNVSMTRSSERYNLYEKKHKEFVDAVRARETTFNNSIAAFRSDIQNLHNTYALFANSVAAESNALSGSQLYGEFLVQPS